MRNNFTFYPVNPYVHSISLEPELPRSRSMTEVCVWDVYWRVSQDQHCGTVKEARTIKKFFGFNKAASKAPADPALAAVIFHQSDFELGQGN